MPKEKTLLQERIESGKPLVLAELTPPPCSDPASLSALARRLAGKVHAVGVTDNRDRLGMSALVAATLVAKEGVEPILHQVTRDRNRIALLADGLGADALGVRNILCTSGTHQTLGPFRAAKNVYDLDPIQLLQAYSNLGEDALLVGQQRIDGVGPLCLGAAASPDADPLELQVMRLAKKATAGARFLITQPVYDLERFHRWWSQVAEQGLQEKLAVVAAVKPFSGAAQAKELAAKRPAPRIPETILSRLAAKDDAAAQRAAGIEIALETLARLSEVRGLRGFQILVEGDTDAALEVLEKSGLKV